MNPRWPVYIPSKGRATRVLFQTARALDLLGVPFRVFVEPQEADAYRALVGAPRVVVLPFENLGQGSIPARNFIWDLAEREGHAWHWVIDDNIQNFMRMTLNRRLPVKSGTIFRCAEDFVERYENVGIAGFNYKWFAPDRSPNIPAFYLNTRVYSMILLRTALPYRWRGRYNEDTDLCLRALKDGWCTILFNAFLGSKTSTMQMKGGNTDTVYATDDHRLGFAQSLVDQHPDVARIVWRYDRWHHEVDYRPFEKNKLRLRAGITPTRDVNEYGMILRRVAKNGSGTTPELPPAPVVEIVDDDGGILGGDDDDGGILGEPGEQEATTPPESGQRSLF